MAFAQDLFEDKLRRILRKIEKAPDKEGEYRKQFCSWIMEYIRQRVEDARQDVMLALCYQLYQADYVSLRRDLAKIKIANLSREATEEERFELLRCLTDCIEVYLKGDYSKLLNYLGNVCTMAEVMKDTDDDNNLPFN